MRSFFKNLSIKWKVLLSAFAIFFFTAFISDGVFLFTIYRTLSYRNYLSNERWANVLASEIGYLYRLGKTKFVKQYLYSNINNYGMVEGVWLYNNKKKLIVVRKNLLTNDFQHIFCIRKNSNRTGFFFRLFNNLKNLATKFTLLGSYPHGHKAYEEYSILTKNLRYNGKNLGFVAIKFNIKKEMKITDSRVFWVGIRFLTIAVVFIILGLLMFYIMTIFLMKPLSEIKENIEKIKNGDYKIVFKNRSDDEIGDVINAIDLMARAIEDYTKKIDSVNKEKGELNCMAVMGEMSAHIAHEVKNTTYVILSANTYIANESENKIVLELTNIIGKEVKRLNRMTIDFLSFTRQRDPELTTIDINKLINESLRVSELELSGLNIKLIKDLISDDVVLIKGDPELLKQVILNLIVNAIDSICTLGVSKNGVIEVRTRVRDGFVNVEISNNGCPIPKENLNKIFQPFFTTKNTGSGLGLPISLRIMKLHNGTINVCGDESRTVFTLVIPLLRLL